MDKAVYPYYKFSTYRSVCIMNVQELSEFVK